MSLSLPKNVLCPSLFWLGFSRKTQAVWTLNMAVVGWVCCYPSLAFPDSSPSRVPSPMCGKKEVTELDWKWFPQDFKDALLCLRSARGGCSYMSTHFVKTHRFCHLVVLVKTVVFWIYSAVSQTLWSSTEWLTGQPGDEESASSLPPSLYCLCRTQTRFHCWHT